MAENEILKELERRLKAKTIHDLRQIARHVGVQRPTEGRKERILDDILNIAAGKIQPVEQSSIGAPPKSNEYDRQLVLEVMQCRAHSLNSIQTEEEGGVILSVASPEGVNEFTADGILEKTDERWFLHVNGKCSIATDISVGENFINDYGLRTGDYISGLAKRKSAESLAALLTIIKVNGAPPSGKLERTNFEELAPAYPDKRINLSESGSVSGRVLDILTPIGLGQRVIVAGPHGSGKTTLLKNIALDVQNGNCGAKIIVLLIDARPEEAADLMRALPAADVISSTLDLSSSAHVRTARLALEYAKRQVESNKHVVLILDSITNLTRAFNGNGVQVCSSLEASALEEAKKFVSCARNVHSGGSLTLIASASYGDDTLEDSIYRNLKEAFNSRITLSSSAVRSRIYPPIDLANSYTSGDERLLTDGELSAMDKLRGSFESGGMQAVLSHFKGTQTNAELIAKLNN